MKLSEENTEELLKTVKLSYVTILEGDRNEDWREAWNYIFSHKLDESLEFYGYTPHGAVKFAKEIRQEMVDKLVQADKMEM